MQEAKSFKEACENLLPLGLARAQEILERKGKSYAGHHIRVLDQLADRVLGRPPMAITGAGGGPLVVSFEQVLKEIDGSKSEKLG